MIARSTERGFGFIEHPSYPVGTPKVLVQESSAIGDYDDAMENPGSSFLWIGGHHHLNREEVIELMGFLQRWLERRRLKD